MKKHFLIIVITLLAQNISSQTHTLGRPFSPVDFESPIDLFGNPERLNEVYQGKSQKSKEIAWLVISDRDNNPTFDKPNGKALKTISFRDFYYVTDEKGAWINIAKGRADKLDLKNGEDYGWVEKSKMLIWNSSLAQERSMISEKVFLVRNLKECQGGMWVPEKGETPIYAGPQSTVKTDSLLNFRFYFIFKKENGRYLIGADNQSSSYNVQRVIMGWIPEKYCTEWNSRICVEPNFEKPAFEERKRNPKLRFVAYDDRSSANEHATSGTPTIGRVVLDQDPCKGNAGTSQSNPYRAPGYIMRYPLLTEPEKNPGFSKIGVFSEGMVNPSTRITEVVNSNVWSGIIEKAKDESKKFESFDLLFVIEATSQMQEFKDDILNGINEAVKALTDERKVRVGALIYRDPVNSKEDRFVKMLKMTPIANVQELINFIKNEPFSSFGDMDPYTGMYFGLNKALKESGLSDLHTNIVFLIGNNADLRADKVIHQTAEEQKNPALIESDALIDQLYRLDAHFYALQCKNNDDRASNYFARQAANLMLETSKMQYTYYADLQKIFPYLAIKEPFCPDLEDNNLIELSNSATPGMLLRPSPAGAISTVQISQFMSDCVKKSVIQAQKNNAGFADLLESGNLESIVKKDGGAGLLPIIKDLVRMKDMTIEEAKKLGYSRFQLYSEAFIPKKIAGAQFPTSSYVVFIPRRDLSEYIRAVRRCTEVIDYGYTTKRSALFNTMADLMRKGLGSPLSDEECAQKTFNQFLWAIQGAEEEDMLLADRNDNFLLGDIIAVNKMTSEKIDALLRRVEKKMRDLQRIYQRGKDYEFSCSIGDEVYFWIPVGDMF